MDTIKIIINRTVTPIKMVIYNFPRTFPIRATWNVIFKGVANAVLVLRGKIDFKPVFKGFAKAKLLLKSKSNFQPIFKGVAKAKLFLKAKSASNLVFNGQAKAKLTLISHAKSNLVFKGIANARTFIYYAWTHYSDDLTWSELDDNITNAEFLYNEII